MKFAKHTRSAHFVLSNFGGGGLSFGSSARTTGLSDNECSDVLTGASHICVEMLQSQTGCSDHAMVQAQADQCQPVFIDQAIQPPAIRRACN